MMSTMTFAQTAEVADEADALTFPIELGDVIEVASEDGASSQLRSVESGLYYARPYGAPYRRYYTSDGSIHSYTEIYVPYFTEYTYANMSNNPTATHWMYKTSLDGEFSERTADANGDLTMGTISIGYMSYIPYLYDEGYESYYNMGYYENDGGKPGEYINRVYCSGNAYDEDNQYGYSWMGWTDTQTNSSTTSSYDTHYVYGSGNNTGRDFTVIDKDGNRSTVNAKYPRDGFQENFPAPMSPMYVESIYVNGITFGLLEGGNPSDDSYEPIQNGAVLTMNIYDQDTDELIATLTATTGDWEPWGTSNSTNYGTYRNGTLRFTKKEIDPLFGEMEAPFVIDRKIFLEITGFYNDNIDVGFKSQPIHECDLDEGFGVGYNTFIDPSGEYTVSTRTSYSGKAISLSFNALMDKIHVAETLYWTNSSTGVQTEVNGYNKLVISADGTTCSVRDVDINSTYNIGGAYVKTTLPWVDEYTYIENYYCDDLPDWITTVDYEPNGDDGADDHIYIISFRAQPNTANASREAVVYIQGKGNQSDLEIIVTQLGADGSDGIENVEAPEVAKTGATYNLAGQKVSENAKGIVIKDGKKVLNK